MILILEGLEESMLAFLMANTSFPTGLILPCQMQEE